jgi:sensor histidine kinase YesM
MNLRKKVFTAFLAFIVVPLFVLGVITYTVSQHIIEENFAEQSEFTLKAVGRNITYMLKEANYFSEAHMLQQDVQAALKEKETVDWIELAEYNRLLQRTFLSYPPVYSAVLYNLRGQGFGDGKIGHKLISFEELIRHPVYEEVKRLNGLSKWIGPHELPELTGDGRLFTQIRIVNDKYTIDNKGILVQQLQFQELDKIFNFFGTGPRKEIRFMIVDGSGVVMVDNMKLLDGSVIFEQTERKFDLSAGYDSGKMTFGGVESVVSVHHLELRDLGSMNWTLVSVTPWAALSGTTVLLLQWIAAITAFCLLCALLFNLLFVHRNIRFILRVVSSMKRAEIGDLDIRVQTRATDETAVLARGFNSLVSRIGALLEEVKLEQRRKTKAELMVLQAQIKPHFLFNTLESINALAAQNEGRKVSQLVQRLGTILRISFSQREEIPISMELDHLRNYLQIQSYRFEKLFDYEIDVPAELASYSILKLTLQPLVENSIQHGFDRMEQGGLIRVRAEEQGDSIVWFVEDNGAGMADGTLSRFRYKTPERVPGTGSAAGSVKPDEERVGLGLPNVADRTRIHYGSRYGLFICSEEGKGTIIRLTIPKYEAG